MYLVSSVSSLHIPGETTTWCFRDTTPPPAARPPLTAAAAFSAESEGIMPSQREAADTMRVCVSSLGGVAPDAACSRVTEDCVNIFTRYFAWIWAGSWPLDSAARVRAGEAVSWYGTGARKTPANTRSQDQVGCEWFNSPSSVSADVGKISCSIKSLVNFPPSLRILRETEHRMMLKPVPSLWSLS